MKLEFIVILILLMGGWLLANPETIANPNLLDGLKSEPDIHLSNWDHEESFNFNKGSYSDVSYTLYNSGNADGLIDVVVKSESGVVARSTEYVPAKSRISNTLRADITINDKTIQLTLNNERKTN